MGIGGAVAAVAIAALLTLAFGGREVPASPAGEGMTASTATSAPPARKPFPNIKTTLIDTRFLKDERNHNLVGDAYAFDTARPRNTLRFDPEGVAVSGSGSVPAPARNVAAPRTSATTHAAEVVVAHVGKPAAAVSEEAAATPAK